MGYPFTDYEQVTPTDADLMAKSKVVQQTLGETMAGATLPVAVYLKAADSKAWKADSDAIATTDPFLGFVIETGNADTVKLCVVGGIVGGFSGLTVGSYYYLQGTAGTIGTAVGTVEKCVGMAVSATEIDMDAKPEGMEYISSASSSAGTDLTAPAQARFALINIVMESGGGTYKDDGDLILAKVGKTTGQLTGTGDGAGGGPKNSISFSWSGTTITVTILAGGGDTANYTAYFYR